MKKIISVLLVTVFALLSAFNVYARDVLPSPDWITVETNPDSSKTLIIRTPTYMIDMIDYYEYSTDGFATISKLSNSEGGEIIISESCDFSLRYTAGHLISETFTLTVSIIRNTVVTSDSTDISIIIPNESPINKNIKLSAFEIISGLDYSAAASAMGEISDFMLFSVSVTLGSADYETPEPYVYLFPSDDLDVNYCKVYHLDENGNALLLESVTEMNMLFCRTELTGMFIIAQDKRFCTGDLNGDGLVQALDARLALRMASKLEIYSDTQLNAGDIDKDGKISAADARKILRFSASLDII